MALLRFMVSGNLQPLQLRLDGLENNQTTQMAAVNTVLQTLRSDVSQDRYSALNVFVYAMCEQYTNDNR